MRREKLLLDSRLSRRSPADTMNGGRTGLAILTEPRKYGV